MTAYTALSRRGTYTRLEIATPQPLRAARKAATQTDAEVRPLAAQVEPAQEASSERRTGGLLGGYTEVASDDKDVAAAADFAAQQLSEQSNSLQPFVVKEVGPGRA